MMQDVKPYKSTSRGSDLSGRRRSSNKASEEAEQDDVRLASMLYTVEETPPWYTCILLGLQHCLTMFGATLTIPLIIAPAMCTTDNEVIAEMLATIFFVSGIVTLLQATIGIRLPIIQGTTFAFLVPTFAILNLPQWKCPVGSTTQGAADNSNLTYVSNTTTPGKSDGKSDIWKSRMLEIQGAIILSSLFEVVAGFSGLIGIVVRFIGPLVIAPTITLVGLALFPAAAGMASKNWYMAILTAFLIVVFSQYMRDVKVPFCSFNAEKKKCALTRSPIFTLFPVIMGIVVAWVFSAILTVTNAIPNNTTHWSYHARTDVKLDVLHTADWFRFPYPFQWGIPTFSVGAVFGMLAGVIAGSIESIGDYFACARLAGAPPPPIHAVNRGICVEGIGCVLAGMWGSGSGTTTYSENIGAVGITKVGSRRVIQVGAVFLLIFGMIGKFGALFVTIPDPVIGGVFLVMFGMIASVGVSNLQYVDLNSSRNLCIYGLSVFFGLCFPSWMSAHNDSIKTGSTIVDQIFTVLLSTSMFVGGAVGFILDNTVPGTLKERGMIKWREQMKSVDEGCSPHPIGEQPRGSATSHDHLSAEPIWTQSGTTFANSSGSDYEDEAAAITNKAMERRLKAKDCYNFPLIMPWLRRFRIFRYIPVCPTFLSCGGKNRRITDQNTRENGMVYVGGYQPQRGSVESDMTGNIAGVHNEMPGVYTGGVVNESYEPTQGDKVVVRHM